MGVGKPGSVPYSDRSGAQAEVGGLRRRDARQSEIAYVDADVRSLKWRRWHGQTDRVPEQLETMRNDFARLVDGGTVITEERSRKAPHLSPRRIFKLRILRSNCSACAAVARCCSSILDGRVSGYVEGRHFRVRDLDALWIGVAIEFAADFETGFRRGVGDQFDDDEEAEEWRRAPVLRDVAEHAMLDLVPLRGPWRIVADLR